MARVPADVRRHELVEAAIRVMARDGVAKATTRAIVAEADMHLGFFHYCFRSKEELLLQVLDAINERNTRAAIEHVQGHRSLRDTLRASVRAYFEHLEKNPGEHQVTYELTQYALRQPALVDVARRQYDNYLAASIRFLEAVAEATRMEWTLPVPTLARFVHNSIDGATLNWIVDRDSGQALAVLDEMAEHLASRARRRRAGADPGG